MTKQQIFNQICEKLAAADLFFGHAVIDEEDEAMMIMMKVFDQNVSSILESGSDSISKMDIHQIQKIVEKRIGSRKPLAYILKEAYFAGLKFYSDERALVPRSPIAELILSKFNSFPQISSTTEVLDLCCGGGSIGVAMAIHSENSKVDLADISSDALNLAEENVALHKVENRTQLIKSDLFQHVSKQYDLILTNPPYVSEAEYLELPKEYINEPKLGLTTEMDGLYIPLKILIEAEKYLKVSGNLILEVGHTDELITDLFPEVDFNWIDFEHGGQGVCIFSRNELLEYKSFFENYLEKNYVV